jgi:hypothetical protein
MKGQKVLVIQECRGIAKRQAVIPYHTKTELPMTLRQLKAWKILGVDFQIKWTEIFSLIGTK